MPPAVPHRSRSRAALGAVSRSAGRSHQFCVGTRLFAARKAAVPGQSMALRRHRAYQGCGPGSRTCRQVGVRVRHPRTVAPGGRRLTPHARRSQRSDGYAAACVVGRVHTRFIECAQQRFTTSRPGSQAWRSRSAAARKQPAAPRSVRRPMSRRGLAVPYRPATASSRRRPRCRGSSRRESLPIRRAFASSSDCPASWVSSTLIWRLPRTRSSAWDVHGVDTGSMGGWTSAF